MKKMMVLSLVLVSLFAAPVTFAADANQFLLNAITVCPVENNPLPLLYKVDGNSFDHAEFVKGSDTKITVALMSNIQLINPMTKAPLRQMGTAEISMEYPKPGYGLQCTLVFIAPDAP